MTEAVATPGGVGAHEEVLGGEAQSSEGFGTHDEGLDAQGRKMVR